jgi:hypothetical protein
MNPAITIATAPVANTPLSQPVAVTAQASSAQDLERLRTLVQGVQAPAANAQVTATPPVAETEKIGFRSLGDSILDGMAKFNAGYNDSLNGINAKVQEISESDPVDFGNNFGEVVALQVEIAQWTMSVMGVDNASKAGTNTIKELSKGG